MPPLPVKHTILIIFVLIVLSVGTYTVLHEKTATPIEIPTETTIEMPPNVVKEEIIGASVEGRNIKVYTYGNGPVKLVFVGGIHGGYEWNSSLLAYTFIDYLEAHPELIPINVTIKIIPAANPDGLYKVTGKEGHFVLADVTKNKDIQTEARFNAHTVDLNRNFDCKWKPESTWRSRKVSAGTQVFSEPEAKTIKSFMQRNKPSAVVFWHSQSNGVYASQCHAGILPETLRIMDTYAKASGYPAIKSFDAYETTGAADDWLASINIPAVTVELKTHETVEWEKNLAGIQALIELFKK